MPDFKPGDRVRVMAHPCDNGFAAIVMSEIDDHGQYEVGIENRTTITYKCYPAELALLPSGPSPKQAEWRPITIGLTQKEIRVLEELATESDMTETQVMRQALRLYQLVRHKAKEGHQLMFSGEENEVCGCGDVE